MLDDVIISYAPRRKYRVTSSLQVDPDCGHDVTEVCQLSDRPIVTSFTWLTVCINNLQHALHLVSKKIMKVSRNYFVIWQGAQTGASFFVTSSKWVTTLSEKSACIRFSPLLSSVIIHCKLKVFSLACIPFNSAPFYADGFYVFAEKCHS